MLKKRGFRFDRDEGDYTVTFSGRRNDEASHSNFDLRIQTQYSDPAAGDQQSLVFGKMSEQKISAISKFLRSCLTQKSHGTTSKRFPEVMMMETKKLREGPKWRNKSSVEIKFQEHPNPKNNLLIFNLPPFKKTENSVNVSIGEDFHVVEELANLIHDLKRKPVSLKLPQEVSSELKKPLARFEIAAKKYYLGDEIGAAKEAREAFHNIKKNSSEFQQYVSDEKLDDIIASRKQLSGIGLHEEDRSETTELEDAEIVLKDMTSLITFLDKKIRSTH